MDVFGQREEVREPKENLHLHRENLHTAVTTKEKVLTTNLNFCNIRFDVSPIRKMRWLYDIFKNPVNFWSTSQFMPRSLPFENRDVHGGF